MGLSHGHHGCGTPYRFLSAFLLIATTTSALSLDPPNDALEHALESRIHVLRVAGLEAIEAVTA